MTGKGLTHVEGVGDLPAGIAARANYPHDNDKDDVETRRGFMHANRHTFDWFFDVNEWAQMDTKQDASYYGHWINPSKRVIVGYIEGDVIVQRCLTDEAFRREIDGQAKFHAGQGYDPYRNGHHIGIDTFLRTSLDDLFKKAGLGHYLHN